MFFTVLMHQSNTVVAVISQMITPAIFILATGNLVNSALVRLARSVDRARILVQQLRSPEAGDAEETAFAMRQLDTYRRRVGFMQAALSSYYVAIFLFVAGSVAIAADVIFGDRFPWLATILVLIGACCLLYGSAAFLVETQFSARAINAEIDRMHARRKTP